MGALIRNINAQSDIDTLIIPRKPDGNYYRYEMVCDGRWTRAYDDTPSGLMNYLIPGYLNLDPEERLAARIRHAVDTQVTLQALINTNVPGVPTNEEKEVLNGPRHIQPIIEEWSCPVPLVLIDTFYNPFTSQPLPLDINEGEIWWIRAGEDDFEYLRSLHDLAVIDLNVSKDEVL